MNNISKKAKIGKNVKIGYASKILDNVIIEDNVIIGDFCLIGFSNKINPKKLIINEGVQINSHSIIYCESNIGKNSIIGHRVLIREESIIENNVQIGSFSDIEGHCKISSYAKLHSNVHVGQDSLIMSYAWLFPYVILTNDPKYVTMREEIFGPVITIYLFDDDKFEETLSLVDQTSEYALTGAILAKDRNVIEKVTKILKHAAGNFYVNDKPSGAVVGRQPFGGARGSGTNDKAGSMLNLLRWVSPRLIKETFVTPKDYRYPFLNKD